MNKNAQYLSIVQGNDFDLTIKVTKYDVDNSSYIDYSLDGCSQVVCFLVAVTGGRRYKLPVTISGNELTAQVDGSLLNVGVMGLELLFEDAENHSKRSYEPALIKIVRTNAEATYTQADFDSNDDCRLHMTIGVNSSFITVGAPTADTEIDGTSYNAVSNAAVSYAITNLQQQIDTIGSEILDPASVYTKDETEALIDTMVDPQEMEEYVSYVASYYTTTEEFEDTNEAISGSLNDLNTRISYIEDNPVDLSAYVSKNYLSQQSYLQSSALNDYATKSYVDEKVAAVDVTDQLTDYATKSYVTEQIAAIPQADMSAYVSKEELNSAAYLQSDDLTDYATKSYVTTYVTDTVAADLSAYVSKDELNAAAYLQSDDLNGYATEAYVVGKIEAIAPTDISGLVSYEYLSQQAYLQADDLSQYATQAYVSEQISAIPEPDLSAYATKSYVSEQIANIPEPDLSAYVTETELNNTLSSYAQLADLISNERVVSTALNSLADRIETVEGDYVSDTELDEALLPYATEAYVVEKIEAIAPTDITGLVSYEYLSQQSYLQADDLTDYATKSYVTTYVTEQVAADLSGYVSKDELNAAAYLQSDDLNGLATEAYVTEQIAAIPDPDLSAYVTKTELNTASYLQADDLTDYATKSYVTTYVTDTVAADLSAYASKEYLSQQAYLQADDLTDYATKSYVTTYVTDTVAADLSAYASKEYLSQQAYITANDVAAMGYVTTTALDTALSSYAKVSDIEDNEQVISTALNTLSDRIDDLEGAGYITTTDMPYKFVVISYADYTALSYKDPQTFYCIPEE